MVRQQHCLDLAETDGGLCDSMEDATPAIDQQNPPGILEQYPGLYSLRRRNRTSSTQKRGLHTSGFESEPQKWSPNVRQPLASGTR